MSVPLSLYRTLKDPVTLLTEIFLPYQRFYKHVEETYRYPILIFKKVEEDSRRLVLHIFKTYDYCKLDR